ncbi:MAG: hypothetical protein KGL53_15535, partial [Elusimicrobia bacterium]|nr:hypothetical protein [Elusimicrobiota bacterium]
TGTEVDYGQTLPVSLPRLIDQMTAEKAQRAGEINTQDAQINDILDRLDKLTNGKYGLSSYKMPVGVGVDDASTARVQAVVDAKTIPNLGDLLTQVANDYKAQAGGVSVGTGDGTTVPTGTQPSPTVNDATQIALLALEAAKRLVPSTNGGPKSAPAAYAVARYLYSDAALSSAKENLYTRIPQALVFLNQAKTALTAAMGDLDKDVADVQANGGGESTDSVVDRKVRVYSDLNAVTRAAMDFYGMKATWDQGSYDTITKMQTYYDSTTTIYNNSGTVDTNEASAIQKMKDALQKTFDDLETQRVKLTGWMTQLNDPNESALKRVAESVRSIQDKTRAVLEQNVQYRDIEQRFKSSQDTLTWTLKRISDVQGQLSSQLSGLSDPAALPPDL